MTDPRWFKLLVRGIGLLLIGISFPSIISALGYIPSLRNPTAPSEYIWPIVIHGAGMFVQLLFGAYLLFGATRLVNYCVRQVHTRCAGCDYDVSGLQGACPECGVSIPTVQIDRPQPPQ